MIVLHATDDVYDKFWAYVLAVNTEIGGFGFATVIDQQLVWHDIFLVDQDVSSGGVDFTDKGLTQAIEHAAATNVFADPNFVWVWWHSHCHHDVYWSGIDEGGIKALKASGIPYMISIVGNHEMKSKVRIDNFGVPLVGHTEFHEMKLQRITYEPDSNVDAEIKEFVRERPLTRSWATGKGTSTSSHGAQASLPAGTRTTDPGDKLDKALSDRAGYSEYSQEELEGTGAFIDGDDVGIDTDDDGAIFNWKDVIEFVEDRQTSDDWKDAGFNVVCYQGEYFILNAPDEHEPSSNDPDFNTMERLETRH